MTATKATNHVRFCDQCIYPGDGGFLFGTIVEGPPCFRCGTREGIHVLDPKVNDPRLAGFFSPTFTTCTEILPFPLIIWDANGYYRDLGVRPTASRNEIRQAYQLLNGHESNRLTYVVSQLLDRAVRARYDATPLGSIFRDDDVEGWIREAKAKMVRDLIQAGEVVPEDILDDGEVVDEMVLDSGADEDETSRTAAHRRGRWPYGYYVWQTPSENEVKLTEWQACLSSVLCKAGEHVEIAIGLQGAIDEPFVVIPVGYRMVVFLHDREWPNDELARQAVSHLHHMSNRGLEPSSTRR